MRIDWRDRGKQSSTDQEDVIPTIQQPGGWSDLELRAGFVLRASMSKMHNVQVGCTNMWCW